jgi:hypothetical protein
VADGLYGCANVLVTGRLAADRQQVAVETFTAVSLVHWGVVGGSVEDANIDIAEDTEDRVTNALFERAGRMQSVGVIAADAQPLQLFEELARRGDRARGSVGTSRGAHEA